MMAAQCAHAGYVFCGTQVTSISVVQRALFLFMPFKTLQYGNRKIFSDVCVLMQSVAFYPCKDATENAGKANLAPA